MTTDLKELNRTHVENSPSQYLSLINLEVFGILTTSFIRKEQEVEYSQVAMAPPTSIN